MVLRRLPHFAAAAMVLLALFQTASAQNLTGTTTILPPATGGTGYVIGPDGTTPYYSAPSTFTPTASGATPGSGSVVTISNGTPDPGLFSFTRPFSTVPPTGTITDSSAIAVATSLANLQPTPQDLQSAFANRLSAPSVFGNAAPLLVTAAVAWLGGAGLLVVRAR